MIRDGAHITLVLGLVLAAAAPVRAQRDPAVGPGIALIEPADAGRRDDPGVGGVPPSATPRVSVQVEIRERTHLPGAVLAPRASLLDTLPTNPALTVTGGGMVTDCCRMRFDVNPLLDQLAREILRHLAVRDLTVVWLIDESASMKDDLQALKARLVRIASELRLHVADRKAEAGALDHAVVGFGRGVHFVQRPTTDLDAVVGAIDRLAPDPTGTENIMHAVRAAIAEYGGRIAGRRRLLIVVATDESGDDGGHLEETIRLAQGREVPIYVLGHQSLFGRDRARLIADGPATRDDGPTIRRGPETADVEVLAWDGLGERRDEQPSGFAPYELARLVWQTGGIYFLLPVEEAMHARPGEVGYSMATLRDYKPDNGARDAYRERRERSPLRRTLHEVMQATRGFSSRLRFPVEPGPMVEAATRSSAEAERQLDALAEIETTLRSLREDREREPERRWKANYDLMLAQVVASRVKLHEYRACLRQMIETRPEPKVARNEAQQVEWVIDHSRRRHASAVRVGPEHAEAERLLKQVVDRHPKTPWADLAQATLDRGLGVERREAHAAPSPPPGGRPGPMPKY